MPEKTGKKRSVPGKERTATTRRTAPDRPRTPPRARRREREATGRTARASIRTTPPAADRKPDEWVPVPLGLKFAGFTAALLVVLTVTVGQVFSGVAVSAIDERINSEGRQVAATLARTIPRVLWERPREEGGIGEIGEERWQAMKAQEERLWEASLKSIVAESDDIRQVIIVDDIDAKEQRWTVASADRAIELGGQHYIRTDGDSRITEGWATSEGRTERIRRFDARIAGRGGATHGWASVFLSAQKIDDAKATFGARIMWATFGAVAVGIGLSFVIARLLTQPLRTLMRDMAEVSRGNLDHRTQSHSRDEIGSLAETFDTMTANLKVARDRELEQRVLEHELDIATEIQTGLLPGRLPQIEGYDVFAYYGSAREVGGDYYDFIEIDADHLGIVVADVSGKGVPGSMVMTMTRSLIRFASLRNPSPADTLRRVNRALSRDIRRGMFVTAVYMILHPKDRTLRVSNAGHNPILRYDARTGEVEEINPRGIAVGFDKGPLFESNLDEITVTLAPGDRILAFTDGVVEAHDPRGEEFGEERVRELLRTAGDLDSKGLVQKLLAEVESHQAGTEQSDDITITTFRLEDVPGGGEGP